jgi:hypothetical protein
MRHLASVTGKERIFNHARSLLWGPRGDYFAVAFCFLAVGLVLQGGGRVPLGDSWSFAWTAAQFVDHGRLAFTEAQAMTLVSQIFLVAPVAVVLSPSPATLNRFTLVLSAVTLSLLLRLYRDVGIDRKLSLLGVATLGANTAWITQSMSFETEIYFLFFATLGTLAFMRWDRTSRSSAPWLVGIAFAAAAGVRQHALLFPIAGVLSMLPSVRLRLRMYLPWVLPFIVVVLVYAWLHTVHGVPKAYGWQREMLRTRYSDPLVALSTSASSAVAAIHYLGWFLLPISLVSVRWPARKWPLLIATAGALAVTAAAALLAFRFGTTMPYLRQLIDPNILLHPLELESWSAGIDALWTVASTAAAVLLIFALTAVPQRVRACRVSGVGCRVSGVGCRVSIAAFLFLPLVALGFVAFYLVVGLGFDRYLLLPLPFLIPVLLIGCSSSRERTGAAAAMITLGALVSLSMVDQRMRSATCEWDAAQALLQLGVPATRINGGVSFNGYYSYDFLMKDPSRELSGPAVPWIQPRAEYLVTMRKLTAPSLTPVSRRICPNLPGFRELEVYTYKCPPSPVPGPPTMCQPFVQ